MTYAFDIPGYVQGTRYSDESPKFWDPTNLRFKDLSPYGDDNDLRITNGTPDFVTLNGQRGVRLDNTCQGVRRHPGPWMVSVIVALAPGYGGVGSTVGALVWLFGDAVGASSNGQVLAQYSSGARKVMLISPNAQLIAQKQRSDDNAVVVGFCFDQETRKAYMTSDFVTVTEVTAPASSTNGIAVAPNMGKYGMRFGNTSGVIGDLVQKTDIRPILLEDAWYDQNIFVAPADLALSKSYADGLKAKYLAS